MLTNKHIVLLGGDARQIEIIHKLSSLDAQLTLVGFDQLNDGYIGATKEVIEHVDWSKTDAIILPVSGMSVDGHIDTIFSNEPIIFKEEFLLETPEHCVIYTGISNDTLDSIVSSCDRSLVKLMERDDVAIYNSIPTAEGTVMMAIQHTDMTVHRSNIAVLGLGRIGMSLARTFAALGAKVKVGANDPAQIARITEMGLEPFHTNQIIEHVKDVDIVINTVPSMILTAKVLMGMKLHALIIDLASKPGGTDFRFAEKRGIKALLAPGLPGIVAPKTAGQILAAVLADLLAEN
ncbi:dipicolinic acid synthetase subunit A [Halalkalibacter sp. APA_J-10(15)]|uniref:dipicolinic acid synthetase subunit A n=1 Tax=unclassified Halalkalibacter TaxID=2893063 RepID=UPI001FF22E7A|nr:dipicolinic acid synthetase subunit A [Halalkalibacter sp. APA_J-10(15)]MCK0470804.1 dipicolinic acid synthetase subunit A [Halalkalibacter sp. APA_J-10(15)]